MSVRSTEVRLAERPHGWPTADTFAIAEILVNDKEEVVQKAVGSWVREAGKRDEARLCRYLDRFAATMPRTALRYAVEKLPAERRTHYLGRRAAT